MQYVLIALGLVLIIVGFWFALRGVGLDTSRGGWRQLKLEAPAWLFLVVLGVGLIVFSATHTWPAAAADTATIDTVLENVGTSPAAPDVTEEGPTIGPSTTVVANDRPSTTPSASDPATSGGSTSSSRTTSPTTDTTTSTTQVPKPDTTTTSRPVTTPTSPTTTAPPLTDCLPYDPATLRIEDEGPTGWLLTDGRSRMKILDNGTDAKAALAVAQRHTSHCLIGRNNTRTNRASYIAEFWIGDSGLAPAVASPDCIAYDPAKLSIIDQGAKGWLLAEGQTWMLTLDNQADAEQALAAAKPWSSQCFVGRDNKRADRMQYIMQYWQ